MSQENVQIVRRCMEFWVSRDYSPMEEYVDPDVVFDMSQNVFNPDIYRGHDGFRRLVEVIEEMWDKFEIETEDVIDAGDQVVTATRISGVGRGSGVEAEMQVFQVWTLRDGKVIRVTGGYRDRSEALDAAGLLKG